MLGRRLLKRLTRLGLATYAMTWCMTFTVCASENPVADIIISDTASLIVESSDTGNDTNILTEGDAGIIPADEDPLDVPADVPADEDLIVGDDEGDIIITDDTPAVSDDIITELTEEAVADEDMVIGTYDDEEYMEADGAGGLPIGGFVRVKDIHINNDTDISINKRADYTYSITAMSTTWEMYNSSENISERLSYGSLYWGLYDYDGFNKTAINATNMPQTLHGITVTKASDNISVSVSFENADSPAKVYLVAAYVETDHSKDETYTVTGKCLVEVDITGTVDDLEAHIPQKSLKLEVFKSKNILPASIRMSDINRSAEIPDFNITNISFGSSMLNRYFTIIQDADSNNLVINATKNVVNDESLVDMLKSYKKGISTNLKLNVTDVDGNQKELVTREKVTLTFGDEKPTAKTVKATNTLEFDCWEPINWWSSPTDTYDIIYRIKDIGFTGPNIKSISIPDTKKDQEIWAKTGLDISELQKYGQVIHSTANLTKKGSGKINVVAVIDDPSYNLPDNYNITVPVSYKIIDSTPTLVLNKSSFSFNMNVTDAQYIQVPCTIKGSGSRYYNGDFSCSVWDSTGKIHYNATNTPVNTSENGGWAYKSGTRLYYRLDITDNAVPGSSYKVILKFESGNPAHNRITTKDITVKVLSEKDSKKMGISVSGKGSIDASVPSSELDLAITGDRVTLYKRKLINDPDNSIKVTLKNNGTDITEYFKIAYKYRPGDRWGMEYDFTNYIITEKTPFSLLKAGYAGKKATANITYKINGKNVSNTYDFTIGNSKVIPKLDTDKVTLNPDFNTQGIIFTMKHDNVRNYNYSIGFTCGKTNATNLFEYGFDPSSNAIRVNPKDPAKMAGKTYTMKVTPIVKDADLPAKPATVKITVLSEKKSALSLSAGTSGSIDAVRNGSAVAVTLKFKNVHNPASEIENITKLNVKSGNGKSVSGKFSVKYEENTTKAYIAYNGDNIDPGTYKATLVVDLKTGDTFITDVSFKVTRGKTNTKLSPTVATLVNRDYSRACPVNVVRGRDVNEITNVALGSGYEDIFTLSSFGSWDDLRLRLKYGYVEKTKKGVPITKAVKKTVPVNVYYNGSSKPDTVKLTVTIEP